MRKVRDQPAKGTSSRSFGGLQRGDGRGGAPLETPLLVQGQLGPGCDRVAWPTGFVLVPVLHGPLHTGRSLLLVTSGRLSMGEACQAPRLVSKANEALLRRSVLGGAVRVFGYPAHTARGPWAQGLHARWLRPYPPLHLTGWCIGVLVP